MAARVDNETELIKYADDTDILTFDNSINKSKIKLEQKKTNLFDIFMNITSQLIPLKLIS